MQDVNLDVRTEWRSGVLGYVLPGGRFMPVIAGGADEGENENENENDENDDEEEEEEGDDEIKDPKAALKSKTELADRLGKKVKKLEKQIKTKEAEIEALKADTRSSDERVNDQLKELQDKAKENEDTVTDRDRVIAILHNDEVAHLPRRRRDLVTKMLFEDVEIEDDGETNVQDLVDDLKKDEPEWFEDSSKKSGKDDEGDENENDESDETPSRRRTATPPKKGKKGKGTYDRASLERRMPHLRKHRP